MFCKKCNLDKNSSDFAKSELKRPTPRCRNCFKTRKKEMQKEREQELEKQFLTEKKCVECFKLKPLSDFNYTELTGKTSKCKNCRALFQTEYYKENKKDIDEKHKIHYQNNKKEINKKRLIRIHSNIELKINRDISSLILKALKDNNSSKNGNSCWKKLEYTPQQLKEHLESLFEPWMSWDNRGLYNKYTWNDNDPSTWTWNIDHIIPKSKFKYTSMDDSEFKKCWSLSNLRPYSAKLNVSEGNRR